MSVEEAVCIIFWDTVEMCLVRLHGMSDADASAKVTGLREGLRDNYWAEVMTLHQEPFYVANNLAGQELDFIATREAYQRIQEEAQARAELAGAPPPWDRIQEATR